MKKVAVRLRPACGEGAHCQRIFSEKNLVYNINLIKFALEPRAE